MKLLKGILRQPSAYQHYLMQIFSYLFQTITLKNLQTLSQIRNQQ